MHGNSYNSFESDVLVAKLNKCEIGDVNHSRIFARALTKDIAATMDVDLEQALSRKLDCTNQLPPVGMVITELYYSLEERSYTCFSNRSVAKNMADFDVN